ncbi:hypothetical protein HanXRQr2_Chr09g0408531 [Helianthus annuus]|uniref:Uncharacterized protein n=1 Tax=Helianthus annuus TaxID=4232 RepID=A0A9K3I9I3_HELAN|nr:hypothetical protein HanXRQr2_Chr09g0408531 [Helianthus annuus]KAJ0894934.1 hypothetical protein HanPSC8_Chr09g0394511 [Helianthus annuus]
MIVSAVIPEPSTKTTRPSSCRHSIFGRRCRLSCLEITFDKPSETLSDLELRWISFATFTSSIAISCPLNEFPTTTTTCKYSTS